MFTAKPIAHGHGIAGAISDFIIQINYEFLCEADRAVAKQGLGRLERDLG